MSILEKLRDLHHQATTERSHYYTGSVITEAIAEIVHLHEQVALWKDRYEAERQAHEATMESYDDALNVRGY